MKCYRLDIYRLGAGKPYEQIEFNARDHEKAGERGDQIMCRRARGETGLLYDLQGRNSDRGVTGEYVVTIAA